MARQLLRLIWQIQLLHRSLNRFRTRHVDTSRMPSFPLAKELVDKTF
jgi:hypothetical protein